jgi:hypothetical protein
MWKALSGLKQDPPRPLVGKIDTDKAAQDIVRSIQQSVCGGEKKCKEAESKWMQKRKVPIFPTRQRKKRSEPMKKIRMRRKIRTEIIKSFSVFCLTRP